MDLYWIVFSYSLKFYFEKKNTRLEFESNKKYKKVFKAPATVVLVRKNEFVPENS